MPRLKCDICHRDRALKATPISRVGLAPSRATMNGTAMKEITEPSPRVTLA